MPYRKKYTARRRYGHRRRNVGLATRPRMMGKTNALRRKHGVDTKTFWFKTNGVLRTTPSSGQYVPFRTWDITLAGGPQSFFVLANLYDQYKVLGMKVRFFPANIGIESDPIPSPANWPLKRGNVAVWLDQRYDPGAQLPTNISEVIGNNNCRMIQPNRKYALSIWRPRGKPTWGSTKNMNTAGDLWGGEISMLINDASATPPNGVPITMWYYTVQYKVIFRARVDD